MGGERFFFTTETQRNTEGHREFERFSEFPVSLCVSLCLCGEKNAHNANIFNNAVANCRGSLVGTMVACPFRNARESGVSVARMGKPIAIAVAGAASPTSSSRTNATTSAADSLSASPASSPG